MFHTDGQVARRFATQGNLRTIHLKDTGVAAGGAQSGGDAGAGQESEFHQTASIVGREVDAFQSGGVTAPQVHQAGNGDRRDRTVVATQLQHGFSMSLSEIPVKRRWPLLGFFSCQSLATASK